jgi:hypothetical protein
MWLVLAVAGAYSSALIAGPWLRPQRWFGYPVVVAAVAVLVACPLLVEAEHVRLRAAAAFVAGDLIFRVIDTFRNRRREPSSIGWGEYCRFLVPFPVLLVVFAERERRLPRNRPWWPELVRIVMGFMGITVAIVALVMLSGSDLLRSSFALDHVTKLVVYVVVIESLARLLVGLERLAGFDTTPIVQNMFMARTVAEFWRRYNRRVHDWFEVNVFRPGGGRHAPVRAVVLVFLVSALFHEVMFDIALSRVDGYQFAFFTLQIPAVLASGRLERLARRGGLVGKVVSHGVAILWMATTSVFFFHGVHQIFPFVYVSEPWLP